MVRNLGFRGLKSICEVNTGAWQEQAQPKLSPSYPTPAPTCQIQTRVTFCFLAKKSTVTRGERELRDFFPSVPDGTVRKLKVN